MSKKINRLVNERIMTALANDEDYDYGDIYSDVCEDLILEDMATMGIDVYEEIVFEDMTDDGIDVYGDISEEDDLPF
jgi:hypothetical protein